MILPPRFLRLCQTLRYSASLLFLLYGAALCIAWLLAPAITGKGQMAGAIGYELLLQMQALTPAQVLALSLPQRLAGGLLALPGLILLGIAWAALVKLLRAYERGDFFSPDALRYNRRFAAGLLAGLLYALLEPSLQMMLFQYWQAQGLAALHLVLDISSGDIWSLLLCALFFLVSELQQAGARLQQENQEFI